MKESPSGQRNAIISFIARSLQTAPNIRGLGTPQEDAQHSYPLDSRVRLAIESDREGHLLLLDEGPEGIICCLRPLVVRAGHPLAGRPQ